MRLEADRLPTTSGPDAEFRKEIEVVKEERRMRTEDQPRPAVEQLARRPRCFTLPTPGRGLDERPDAMTPDDAPVPPAVVCARQRHRGGGRVMGWAKVRALAEKYYGSIPARAVPQRKPRTEPAQRGLRRIEVKAPAEQAYGAGVSVPRLACPMP